LSASVCASLTYVSISAFAFVQVVYGEDVAILAGDAMLSTAFQHVAENVDTDVVEPKRVLDVLQRLGQSVGPKGLAGGQVMDLECEGKDGVTLDDLRWIHTHKTATLLVVAVASGAVLAGASPEEVEKLEEFALKIGLAFQVADDILDVTQSTEELGKTAGKDEDTSKTTYPKLLGLDGSRAEAERLVAEAKQALEQFGDRATPLLALADYIINRKN
jgi:geranylgeranyl diphosphate synthase, type II